MFRVFHVLPSTQPLSDTKADDREFNFPSTTPLFQTTQELRISKQTHRPIVLPPVLSTQDECEWDWKSIGSKEENKYNK